MHPDNYLTRSRLAGKSSYVQDDQGGYVEVRSPTGYFEVSLSLTYRYPPDSVRITLEERNFNRARSVLLDVFCRRVGWTYLADRQNEILKYPSELFARVLDLETKFINDVVHEPTVMRRLDEVTVVWERPISRSYLNGRTCVEAAEELAALFELHHIETARNNMVCSDEFKALLPGLKAEWDYRLSGSATTAPSPAVYR